MRMAEYREQIGLDMSVPDFQVKKIDDAKMGTRLANILRYFEENYSQGSYSRWITSVLREQNDDFENVYPEIIGSTLKVPHHGSKHNLTTEVIKKLKPSQSVISCRGSKKHPNPAIVHYLSKYGKVFSTSKSGTLTYYSTKAEHPATPLRDKHD